MARIAGVDLPKNKRIEIGLTYIYGIGRSTADEILAGTGVNPDVRVKDLSEEDVAKLRDYIDKPSSPWVVRRSSAASALVRWRFGRWRLTALPTPCRRS